jgi:hypothetical protein
MINMLFTLHYNIIGRQESCEHPAGQLHIEEVKGDNRPKKETGDVIPTANQHPSVFW